MLLVAAILLHSDMLALPASVITSYYYAVFLAGLFLAARFRSTRVLFSLVVLMLAHRALEFFSGGRVELSGPGHTAFILLTVLVPLNFIALSAMQERGLKVAGIAPRLGMLLAQAVAMTLACRPGASDPPLLGATSGAMGAGHTVGLPYVAVIATLAAGVFFCFRYVRSQKPLETGFIWSLASVYLSFHFGGIGRIADGYMATAGLILAASVVETSYIMAYHDELTTLPGRRAFNETLASLDGPYAIAIVDIDHFKRFNDTYGHEVGDEVLRMVASRLLRVTGGGKAFRCGGEEFAILFEGKSAKEAVEELELLRQAIETSVFRVRRGFERRQAPRESTRDRRQPAGRRAKLDQVARIPTHDELSVTVSIGVAEPSTRLHRVDQVIHAADKALYRAKGAGRNRVELATSVRPRPLRARKASA